MNQTGWENTTRVLQKSLDLCFTALLDLDFKSFDISRYADLACYRMPDAASGRPVITLPGGERERSGVTWPQGDMLHRLMGPPRCLEGKLELCGDHNHGQDPNIQQEGRQAICQHMSLDQWSQEEQCEDGHQWQSQ